MPPVTLHFLKIFLPHISQSIRHGMFLVFYSLEEIFPLTSVVFSFPFHILKSFQEFHGAKNFWNFLCYAIFLFYTCLQPFFFWQQLPSDRFTAENCLKRYIWSACKSRWPEKMSGRTPHFFIWDNSLFYQLLFLIFVSFCISWAISEKHNNR